MTQKSRLISGRVPVTSPTLVTSDRYQWLSLDQAEPNLGVGSNNAILSTTISGQRTWTTTPSVSNISVATSANIAGIIANASGIFWPNGTGYSSGITYSNSNVQVLLNAFTGNLNVGGYINVNGQINGDVIDANTTLYSRGGIVTTTGLTWAGNGAPYYSDANVQTVINNYTGNVGGYAGANQPYIQYLSGVSNITIANTVVLGPSATIQFANGAPIIYGNTQLQSALGTYGANVVKAGYIYGNNIIGGTVTSNTSVTLGTGLFWSNGVNYSVTIQGSIPAYSNANVVANVTQYLPYYTGLLGGTLVNASQPNITAVGTLTSLTVSGGASFQNGPSTFGGTTTFNGNMVAGSTAYLQSDTYIAGNLNSSGTYANLNVTTLNTTASNLNIASAAVSKLNHLW